MKQSRALAIDSAFMRKKPESRDRRSHALRIGQALCQIRACSPLASLTVERRDDARGDVVLQREIVIEHAVVLLRPRHRAGDRVRELHAHAHLISRSLHRSFEHITHAGPRCRRPWPTSRASRWRCRRPQEDARHLGERILNVDAQALGERFAFFLIVADGLEGQEHDRRPVGQRQIKRMQLEREIALDDAEAPLRPPVHSLRVSDFVVANAESAGKAAWTLSLNRTASGCARSQAAARCSTAGPPGPSAPSLDVSARDAETIVHAAFGRQIAVHLRKRVTRVGRSRHAAFARRCRTAMTVSGRRRKNSSAAMLQIRDDQFAAVAQRVARRAFILAHQHAEGARLRAHDNGDRAVPAESCAPETAGFLSHVADESEAFAGQGLDQCLRFPAVADRGARRIDARRQRRFGDDSAVPNGVDQIVFADDPVAILDQIEDEIEDLRLDRNKRRAAANFAAFDVKKLLAETISQVSALRRQLQFTVGRPSASNSQGGLKQKTSLP